MRPRRKVSLIFWLLIAALLPLAILPPFGFVSWPHDRMIVSAALVGILLAMFWRAWMIRRLAHQEGISAHRRYGELKRELLTLGHAVPIDGAAGIGLLLLIAAVAALFVWGAMSSHKTGLVLGALLFSLILVVEFLLRLPAIGKPVLTLTRAGVQPAGYGLLPWSAVQGIDLTVTEHPFGRTSHVLNLFVPDLRDRLSGAHLSIRLLRSIVRSRRFSTVVAVRLRSTSESPALIERLCRDLWKAAAGCDHVWSPHLATGTSHLTPASMRMQMAWMRLVIAFAIAFMVLGVANQIVDMITSFVASSAWTMVSLGAAAILVLAGYALLMQQLKSIAEGTLKGGRMAGVLAAMAAAALVVFVPITGLLISNAVGDPIARKYGIAQEISVTATKEDSYRRRGCNQRLYGVELGRAICLTREEYDRLPQQVRVALHIRRSALGYYVDTQTIER